MDGRIDNLTTSLEEQLISQRTSVFSNDQAVALKFLATISQNEITNKVPVSGMGGVSALKMQQSLCCWVPRMCRYAPPLWHMVSELLRICAKALTTGWIKKALPH